MASKICNLSRLICMIHPENQASVKVAQNIGMALEKEMEDELGPYLLFSRVKGDRDASPTL